MRHPARPTAVPRAGVSTTSRFRGSVSLVQPGCPTSLSCSGYPPTRAGGDRQAPRVAPGSADRCKHVLVRKHHLSAPSTVAGQRPLLRLPHPGLHQLAQSGPAFRAPVSPPAPSASPDQRLRSRCLLVKVPSRRLGMKIALHRCRAEIAAPGLPRSCATSLWQTPRYMRPPRSTHLRGPLRQSLNQRNQSVPGFCRFVKGFETIKSGPSLGQSRDSSVPTRSSGSRRQIYMSRGEVSRVNPGAIP